MPKHTSWLFEDTDTLLYKTDLYGGADADIDGTEKYTADIDLSVWSGASIDFKFTGSDSTDNLLLNIYNSRDGSWAGTEIVWKSQLTVENSGLQSKYHYTIPEAYQPGYYRFGMMRSGSTTTFDIEVNCRRWRKTESKA